MSQGRLGAHFGLDINDILGHLCRRNRVKKDETTMKREKQTKQNEHCTSFSYSGVKLDGDEEAAEEGGS